MESTEKARHTEDRVIAESIQRIVKTYVYSKALESYLRYVKDIRVIYTETGPSIEILLAIPGKAHSILIAFYPLDHRDIGSKPRRKDLG